MGPGVDSACNRNAYQDYFLGLKAAVARADNLAPSCAVVMKSGNINFLEPSGPLQACSGTAALTVFCENCAEHLGSKNPENISESCWEILTPQEGSCSIKMMVHICGVTSRTYLVM